MMDSRFCGPGPGPGAPFLEAPGNYRARQAVLLFILDSSFKKFENCTVKLSAKETKWTSLEVRTHPTFLENLISKYDFGSVKLLGLSRNGSLARVIMFRSRARHGVFFQPGGLLVTGQQM